MFDGPSRSVTASLRWAAATVVALVLSAVAGIAALAARAPADTPSQPRPASALAAVPSQPRPAVAPAAKTTGSVVPVAPVSDAELAWARIEMERTMCYGHCPEYEVTISGSGKVLYGGKENVKVKGTRRATVDREKVRQLLAAFDRAKF